MALGMGIAQGHDFGVRAAGLLGVALADQFAVCVGDGAADARIGVGAVQRIYSDVERLFPRIIQCHDCCCHRQQELAAVAASVPVAPFTPAWFSVIVAQRESPACTAPGTASSA